MRDYYSSLQYLDIHILNIYSSLQLTYTFKMRYCCICLCCFALCCYQNYEGLHSVRLFDLAVLMSCCLVRNNKSLLVVNWLLFYHFHAET